MAKSEQYVDWQSTKNTVLERSRHMFNNPFMSDITFSCDGSDKKLFAHKYILGTSSAVFYAMFYGELAEKNFVVHLSDTSEEILGEFLRFLYTDMCNLTTDNAMFVLYLAKKYIVPPLAQKCIEFLEAHLTPENVFKVLNQALQLDEEKLVNKCWNLVDLQADDVVASATFADITQSTLEELLKRESLKVKEVDLFEGVLKWSEAECSRKGIETNANNKRVVMGNAIYQIRFASMTAQEFSLITSKSDILKPEEAILFYHSICGVEVASNVWNLTERGAKERTVLRCCRFDSFRKNNLKLSIFKSTTEHTICVSFSEPVYFHGVHLLGNDGEEYDVKLDVFSQSVREKFRSQRNSRGLSGFDVTLPVRIKVQAYAVVQLKATITGSFILRCGSEGRKKVVKKGVTVNFFNTPGVHSGDTTEEQGQFDEIIFSKV